MTPEETPGNTASETRRSLSMSHQHSLVDLAGTLARHPRATVAFPLVVALSTGVVSWLLPPTYTATTTFVPEASPQGRLPSGLAGLATQFGISLGSEASRSPQFYAQVVRSRELMERVLLSNYAERRDGHHVATDSATLVRLLRVVGRDSAETISRGVGKLDGLVSVRVDNQTNIVTLSVDAPYPTLAAAIANRFVAYLNAFNAQYRQSQAREQREFVEQRLRDGEHELQGAEEELRHFYEHNRSWQQAPQLTFEEGRLRRQVEIRQEVYLTLKREYETARIQEVNDTPVITVIDAAAPPSRRSKPQRSLLVIVALVLGTMVGAFWATSVEYLNRAHREQGDRQSDSMVNAIP